MSRDNEFFWSGHMDGQDLCPVREAKCPRNTSRNSEMRPEMSNLQPKAVLGPTGQLQINPPYALVPSRGSLLPIPSRYYHGLIPIHTVERAEEHRDDAFRGVIRAEGKTRGTAVSAEQAHMRWGLALTRIQSARNSDDTGTTRQPVPGIGLNEASAVGSAIQRKRMLHCMVQRSWILSVRTRRGES